MAKGRTPGSKNKATVEAEEIFRRLKCNPLEVLCHITNGDWKALGYETKSKISFTAQGIEFEEDHVKLEHRVTAAKEAVKYLYPQKKAIQLEASSETGFKIVVEDYTGKK